MGDFVVPVWPWLYSASGGVFMAERVKKISPRLPGQAPALGSPVPLALGTRFAGRYALRSELGRGSMGSVWLAQDSRLQRLVAVKILSSHWTKTRDALTRFEREAQAVAKLRSPHIVQVFDYGIEQGRPFIVMELLDGEELRSRFKRRRRLSAKETGTIVLQTCRALHVAHQAGVVHRDLKPGNIMLDKSTGDELVKVLDFGVAKRQADHQTETTKEGTLIGTPQYMAPEQARARPDVDHRADLWSLGVITYRALTGELPFRADTVVDIIVKICTSPVPKATAVCPELPEAIDEFFARALARDREERIASAREFASSFFGAMDTSSPSLSGLESGRFLALTDDVLSQSHPLSASHPVAPASDPSVSQPAGDPSSSRTPLVSDTLPSASEVAPEASQRSEAVTLRPSATLDTPSPMVDDIPLEKSRKGLVVGLALVTVVVLAGAAFLATRPPGESSPAGATTAAEPTDVDPGPEATVAAATATETGATTEAAAPDASAPASGTAAEAGAAPTATPQRAPVRPPRRRPPGRQPPKQDDGDLLDSRF